MDGVRRFGAARGSQNGAGGTIAPQLSAGSAGIGLIYGRSLGYVPAGGGGEEGG